MDSAVVASYLETATAAAHPSGTWQTDEKSAG